MGKFSTDDSVYKTKTIEFTIEDILDCLDDQGYEVFLDKLSKLHSNTDLLMDITFEEVQPMLIRVDGDVSEARELEEFL